jgi:GT2 family glycosyltransferase
VRIEQACAARGFGSSCRVVRVPRRIGRPAAHNLGIRTAPAEFYLLMNGDTRLRERALGELFSQMQRHAGAGIAGPQLEAADGSALPSAFRDPSPLRELLTAAPLERLRGLLPQLELSLPASDTARDVDWVSFACVLIRREVIDQVGLLDEGYFLHFEDSDYCRAARGSGFRVRYCPRARVVHLRAGDLPAASRRPRHYYAARARYFRKGYGLPGLWGANALWQLGRSVAAGCELTGVSPAAAHEGEWFDNWTDALKFQD